ncbi:UPF0524 protein C3orf70 homolog B-like [Alosa sapidissima]|uniref:UPF0524 protein C3orf70 homolog B-like n=1 Tax=Alosa sapidissima TaxID=34773 RepID=UPI001C0A29DB|nr:UPF0524 protein C3orf70 homolog B-like [Alosa sapidissima]XP_041926177.1 UPF0524 protein C3orf70 homolog B-like [Alosa sapidissima]
MASSGAHKTTKSEKLDEAQALAKSCAGRPDFLPCDGLSICATHSHGKCFKLHWCCHLGWCHCKYVYQPMTRVGQLPSTTVPPAPSEATDTIDLSISLTERFLRIAPWFLPPPCPESPRYCVISDLFIDDYVVKRINGKMCYVQRPPPMMPVAPPTPHPHPHQHPHFPPHPRPPTPPPSQPQPQAPSSTYQNTQEVAPPPQSSNGPMEKAQGPKMDHCSSPSSSEDSGINAIGGNFLESCEEDSCEEEEEEEEDVRRGVEVGEEDELSSDGKSSPASWDQDECSLLSPSKSLVEIIENIETTV